MVTSARMWLSAVCWVSPTCIVCLFEREAVGLDGEQYAWTWLMVCEVRDGQFTSMCDFEPEDEAAAFAYAEQLVAARSSRLAVANVATDGERRVHERLGQPDFDPAFLSFTHEQVRLVDRRAMPGTPWFGRKAALVNFRRFLIDYPDLDIVPLAVRGERVALVEYRGRTPGGYEATYLNVNEVDAAGQLVEQVRFDGDDFEGAYRELEQRHYTGEGAAFAAGGALQADYVTALNRRDLDRVFGELSTPDFRITTRSRSVFGDRSAAEVRTGMEELAAMVASARTWLSAVRWLTPAMCVVRLERRAVGVDGEAFAWTKLYPSEVRDGRLATMCEFELEDEDQAFAYADEQVRRAEDR